jgi:hypothetical protein
MKGKEKILGYLKGSFGIDSRIFDNFGFYEGGKGRVFLGPKKAIEKPEIVSLGMTIARINHSVKPSTNLFQLFGSI